MTNLSLHQTTRAGAGLLPTEARHYLAHTAQGKPIRELAREAGCHASTILRQVRKLETMRDDPLVDRALSLADDSADAPGLTDADLREVTEGLTALCQPGVLLVYNRDLPKTALVRTTGEGDATLVGTVSINIAAALFMRSWIAPDGGSAVKRYRITSEGRLCLPDLVAARDRHPPGRLPATLDMVSDAPGMDRRSRDRTVSNGPGSENPLTALARRRGPDGKPFLPPAFVAAGDRLHEDFGISGFEKSDLLGWEKPEQLDRFYARARSTQDTRRADAIHRTLNAIRDLGPGLSDVALRCCCLREGLETTEKRMGWSARSGKVVLRIALQRLSLFYTAHKTRDGMLIG